MNRVLSMCSIGQLLSLEEVCIAITIDDLKKIGCINAVDAPIS
jgi:hypothetical protein